MPDKSNLPVVALKDMVIFPKSVVPLIIGREHSVNAVEDAVIKDSIVIVVCQRDNKKEEIRAKDMYRFGVSVKIVQLTRLPNGLIKVLVESIEKVKILKFTNTKNTFYAEYESLKESFKITNELKAKQRKLNELFVNYASLNKNIANEISLSLNQLHDLDEVVYFVISHLEIKASAKQKILELNKFDDKINLLIKSIQSEIDVLLLQEDINERVRDKVLKTQRNHFILEQIRILKEELGEDDESSNDIEKLEDRIEVAEMPNHAFVKAREELNRLKMISFMSPEASVTRNYIEWLVDIPWKDKSEDAVDLKEAKQKLDDDHYGLKEVKDRILDFLAVLKIRNTFKGPILCLLGPPGVGKTSLGKSIANVMNREFVRISLGGVRDEAEIRGHRKTYIGAMPGKIIQAMKKAGTINPVILLDEIDKMASDMRGDPASALLEVLDPEQNNSFVDHFLEVEYDLSKVLFICTANFYEGIPAPLLDRMEIIQLNSYIENEKKHIAKDFLLPKIMKEHGLDNMNVTFQDKFILKIIREYTREAGVRQVHQQLSKLVRKITRRFAETEKLASYALTEKDFDEFLGKAKFKDQPYKSGSHVGVAIGMAWTSTGGDLLPVEVNIVKGKEKLSLTGKLGDVMKESAQASLSYIRSNAKLYNIEDSYFENKEIHIHVPEGAVPKDGPSAGVTITTAVLSAILNKKIKRIAMTGEITLRGHVLAIGGLKEKLMSAIRYGIKRSCNS